MICEFNSFRLQALRGERIFALPGVGTSWAAIVAHLNEAHQEFFPVYTAITVAAVLHLHATVNRNRRTPPPDGEARLQIEASGPLQNGSSTDQGQ